LGLLGILLLQWGMCLYLVSLILTETLWKSLYLWSSIPAICYL